MRDAIVVGGGPGGLVAAEGLAKAGYDVLLCEDHDTIGSPVHCTGVLAQEAIDTLPLPHAAVLNPLSTVRFFAPTGTSFEYTTTTVEAVVIDRLVFDRSLAEAAQRAGVLVRRSARVAAVDTTPHEVLVTLADGEVLTARVAILACGASYGLQKRLGLGMPSTFLQSAQIEMPADTPGDVEVHFGSEVAPKGFAWAVPVRRVNGTFARIGVMAEGDAGVYFERMLQRVAKRWGLHPPVPTEPRRKMLPLGAIARTYTDRVVVVGDAAGLVKPTTGGGIYYSVLSGSIAASVLARQLARDALDAVSLADYQRQWQKRFQPEFAAQSKLRRAAQNLRDEDIDELFHLAHSDGIIPLVRKTARFNRHRELIFSLFQHPPARRVLLRHLSRAYV
jgi:digeranylgeranylglycerophospholipid reductase